ncbi:hypothetical protein FRB95_004358 [Tulasnella sp. JGI-2019a]|nr:hypothetical protein FRB95_004358 [Tulasnella sp. JGI-2019a]
MPPKSYKLTGEKLENTHRAQIRTLLKAGFETKQIEKWCCRTQSNSRCRGPVARSHETLRQPLVPRRQQKDGTRRMMSLIVLKDGHPLPHYLLGSRNAPRKTQRLDSKCHKSPVTGAPDGDAGDNGNGNNEDEDEVGSIEKKKAIAPARTPLSGEGSPAEDRQYIIVSEDEFKPMVEMEDSKLEKYHALESLRASSGLVNFSTGRTSCSSLRPSPCVIPTTSSTHPAPPATPHRSLLRFLPGINPSPTKHTLIFQRVGLVDSRHLKALCAMGQA